MFSLNHKLLYLFSALFIALNAWFLLNYESVVIAALPIALYLILVSFFQTEKVLLFIFFCAPLSMNLEDMGDFGIGMYLPTEPILFGLTILFLFDQLRKPSLDKGIIFHPISITIYLYLIWLVITSITSVRPDVSVKFLLSRIWFIVPIYFYGSELFKKKKLRIQSIWLYMIPLTGVVIYTLIRHAAHGFEEDPGHWVMTPFYKDHTSYGALIALFFPFIVGFILEKDLPFWRRYTNYFIFLVLLIGLYFSFTRAAWLSLVLGLGVATVLYYQVKFKYLLILGGIAVVFFLNERDKILMDLERNKSEHTTEDFEERLESVSNISTDASNLERINRWNSAISMWREKPVEGYGPGTYAMEYGVHQHPKDMTIISSRFGDMGNAHSEYLGHLSEAGLLGAITFALIVIMVFYKGVLLYNRLEPGEDRKLVMLILVALSTYFSHSALNNYLDTDKAAVPVWGMIAILVATEITTRKQDSDKAIEL